MDGIHLLSGSHHRYCHFNYGSFGIEECKLLEFDCFFLLMILLSLFTCYLCSADSKGWQGT